MKRKELKLGESYYVNSYQDHYTYALYKNTAERKLVHLGPFSKESRHGFQLTRLTESDRTVALEDGREVLLPYGHFPTGKYDTATHVLVENLSTGKFEAVTAAAIRLPWSEFVTRRDAAVKAEDEQDNIRKTREAREDALAAKIRKAHPGVEFRLTRRFGYSEVVISLSELAKIAGVEA